MENGKNYYIRFSLHAKIKIFFIQQCESYRNHLAIYQNYVAKVHFMFAFCLQTQLKENNFS